MPNIVLKDVEVLVNAVDLSIDTISATVNYGGEIQEATGMNSAGVRTKLAGLTDWSIELSLNQDFDSGRVDATLFTLIGAAGVTISVMGNKTTGVGVTNPKFSGTALLESYGPIAGGIGEVAVVSATFQGSGALTRATA